MAASRRVRVLVSRIRSCLQENLVAGERDAAGDLYRQPCSGNQIARIWTSASGVPLSSGFGGYQNVFGPDSAFKRTQPFRGSYVRLASGTTTHAASAEAAATAREIREEVKKIREEASVKEDKEEEKATHQAKAGKEKEEEEVIDEKTKALRAALIHVPKLGWTEAAMIAGARDVGLSPAIVGAFQRKEAALVEFFMDECNLALNEEVEDREEELAKMVLSDRVAAIVWMRLEMQIPYSSKWPQALSIQANPLNVPATVKQRAHLVDDIWHAAGDRSADMDWYAKRALLAGVYSTTELYMLTDTSPGFRDTKTFLSRRIGDAIDCRKSVQEATHLTQALGAGFQNTVNAFLNRSRAPPSGF